MNRHDRSTIGMASAARASEARRRRLVADAAQDMDAPGRHAWSGPATDALPALERPADAGRAPKDEAQEARERKNRDLSFLAARRLHQARCLDVTALDLRNLVDYADYAVLATAHGRAHAAGAGREMERALREAGALPPVRHGHGGWFIWDFGEIVAHVMEKEARNFFRLEDFWRAAPRMAWEATAATVKTPALAPEGEQEMATKVAAKKPAAKKAPAKKPAAKKTPAKKPAVKKTAKK